MPPPDSPSSAIATFPGAQPADKSACGTCFFWRPIKQSAKPTDAGFCLRYPPTIHNLGPELLVNGQPKRGLNGQLIPNLQPLRPVVAQTDYCGEWQPPLGRDRE